MASRAGPVSTSGSEEMLRRRLEWLGRSFAKVVASLFVLVTVCFLLVHLIPGDPVRATLGITAPAELVEARRQALGLDQPILAQYGDYLAGLLRGDLGTSFGSQLPVADIIAQRLPNTLLLSLVSLTVVLLAGVPIGLWAAAASWSGRSAIETSFNVGSGILTAMPEFISAVVLTSIFAVTLHWLPVAGMSGPSSLVLPVAALSIGPAAALARIVRMEALKVLAEDYIRTARAKRLGWRKIYLRHALPNCLTATLTVGGLLLSGLVAGTILVENIFAWPGIGSAIVLSITQKDYPLTQGLILMFGTIILLVNLGVDILIATLDPRSTMAHD